jgi:hypothetical protein
MKLHYSARGTIPVLVVSLFVTMTLALSTPALSQSPSRDARSAEEVAAELANPNTALGVLGFPFDFVRYGGDLNGASDESGYKINFQPSLPVPIGEGVNFFARPLIPFALSQPVPTGTGFESKAGLGDISFDAAVGKTFKSGVIAVGGVVGSLPTATDDALGTGQFLLGPEALIGWVQKWGALGALVTQSWRVAGGDDEEHANITGGQYFYTFNLRNAWQISAQPTWSYNHKASEGNRLALPVGVGVSKTVIAGATPWKFSLQYWYYVASPDLFGPVHQVRLQVAAVVPLPW